MLIDKDIVLYRIDKALAEEPESKALAMLQVYVTAMTPVATFICNGEACEEGCQSCRLGGPAACTHTTRIEYAENFEPVRDEQGRCFGFIEKGAQE